MNLFELFVKIGVDDQASGKISKISQGLGNGLKTAAKVGAAAVGAASTAIVALGKIGFDYNKQIETYTTNFEVMMGDAEAAARKVEELKEMGARTPFELGDLANATQTLLAFNVSADDSTGVLSKLGDISLGNVQKLESLTRAYGKMNASQKVTLEDINMMIDAGFNPLLIVAENTGETMEEVYDRISEGGVSFEEISGAINQATSEGGQFYQGMEKASQTTQGLISTLKDAAQSKIGELFSDISEKIKELLPNVISFVENIDTEEIVTGVENLMQTFENLLPVITGVTAATVAYKVATSIAGVIDALRKATEGQTLAQTLLNAVMNANPFVLVATLIAGLVAALVTLWNTNEGFRKAVSNIWGEIQDLFSGAWEFIKNIWAEVLPYFEAIWEGIRSTFSVVTEILGGFFSAAWSAIKSVWSVVSSYFDTVWNTIKGIFSVVESVLSGNFSDAWEAIKGIFDGWAEFFEGLWDDLTGVFSDAWEWFSELGGEIVDGIKSGISAAWDGLVSWFNGIWDSIFGNRTANITVNKTVNTIHGGGGGKFGSVDGSHASGLDYVPFDGYIAELHKGERVLTAKEAKKYPVSTNFNGDINIIVQGDKYRDENALADAIAEKLQMMTDRRAAVYA